MTRKIVTVIGARPQFIKAAAVSREISKHHEVEEVLVHTGQHFDDSMSQVFFDELDIAPPAHNLGIQAVGHGAMTGRMLEKLEEVIQQERPDWVLVYGDTNSTLAGALSAAKLHVSVAHVEAGLRSFNRRMPEEINRVVTDHLSDMLLAPTSNAVENLAREGIGSTQVHLVGDVMYDIALYYADRAVKSSRILERLGLTAKGYVLATVHRAENTDDRQRLRAIVDGLAQVALDLPVVLPLHPRSRAALAANDLLDRAGERLTLLEPVGYLDMVMLEKSAAAVATDSGGVQKEAYFHGVPCVTLREETEWVELVDLGWNRLAPPGTARIVESVREALSSTGRSSEPYGRGDASVRIAGLLRDDPRC